MTCDKCSTDGHLRIKSLGGGIWACAECAWTEKNSSHAPALIEMVHIDGYGKTEASRIRELSRRVVIADKEDKTGYHVGRLNENGTISEKVPSY